MYGFVADADPSRNRIQAISAMTEDSLLPFSFPAVDRKKITAAFDGGRITSDAGVVLLGQAERRRGLAGKLAAVIADPSNTLLITHPLGSILRTLILAIACGYEDADDLDHLRKDPAFRLACGCLPATGDDLHSQPTMSRWDNALTLREILKLSGVLIDFYCASSATPPKPSHSISTILAMSRIGHQQLSLFNAH
jgi:Transposase DDE domain group 1